MASALSIPLRTPECIVRIPDAVASVSWAPDSRLAVVAGVGGRLWILDDSGRVVRELAGHNGGAFRALWHPKENLIASAGQDGHVRFWNPQDGQAAGEFPAGGAWVEQLDWSPAGDWLASGAGRVLTLWQPGRGVVHTHRDHRSTLSALAWRRDGARLAVACYGGAHVYDCASGQSVDVLPWKTSILSLAWSPDGRWVVGGTQDQAVQVWEQPFKPGNELAMSGYPAKVRELAWHPSSRYLATGGGETIMAWDCSGAGPSGTSPRLLEGHAARITCLAYQRSGHLLASSAEDGQVLVWNVGKSLQALRQIRLDSAVTALAWSADDRTVLAGTHDGSLALIRTPAG